MGTMIKLKAKDGHELDAYLAAPKGRAKGGIVVVQEIFGVTNHIERVADQFAANGYKVVAPAMFDRVERNVTLAYSEIDKGREYMRRLEWPNTLADVEAAAREASGAGDVAVVGYCWGGTVAHVAASELDINAAISYYGGAVAKMLDKKPRSPIMYHFGDQDASIPLSDIELIKKAVPNSALHVYPGAGHGFNCDERGSYSAKDAKLAFERSIEFLNEQLD
ncbi:MAG TPA: dienelactone hydrolase family protein [Gammaproteobacteria bacterium]|nr:dienelactone hydrolase family protein [Gammaproteobacteria bacterium]